MDKKSIRFHVEAGDYFGTLGTRVDLLLQDISKRGYGAKHKKSLEDMRNEAIYLQECCDMKWPNKKN